MNRDFNIRTLQRDDLAGVRLVLDGTDLFPSEMLGEMAEPFLSGRAPHFWIVAVRGDETVGFAYCEPERLTEGTYNLLAIAVAPDHQRSGSGTALVRGIEALLRGQGGRLLLVETSTDPDQDGARAFYLRDGFTEEARIRDFYAPGQSKVVFRKQL